MSAGLSRRATGATVVSDLGNSAGGLNPWIHPDTVAGTDGWSKAAATGASAGLYDNTKNRRYLTVPTDADGRTDASTGIEYSWSAAPSGVTGAVGWGKPRLSGSANLIVVFRSSSL
jgi:hypothetical protein